MRAKKDSDYQEMFLGGRMRAKRKQGKGFFGNSQARFSGMAGAGEGIDMSFKGAGPFAGKGRALRREKRQLKRALKSGGLNKEQSDRLGYLRSVQKDRAKKAVGAGALAAGAAFGGAALAGKLGAKGAGGMFKGGMKGVFKGGAKSAGQEAGKGGFREALRNQGKGFLRGLLQGGGGQQPQQSMNTPMYQPMPQFMPQPVPQTEPTEDRSLQMGEDGMKVMKYRGGGMMPKYEEGGPVVKDVSSLLAALGEVKAPEDYTDAEFEEVRGRAKMGDRQARKPSGGALDRDIAQPMEFEVRKYGSDSPSRSYERFELRNVELGGVDEETGMMRPNVLTLPPEIYDMMEDGTIERKDIQQALGQSYSRSDDQGRRTMPVFLRGEEDEPRQPGTPGKGKIKIKKNREFTLPQLPYMTSPKYAGGRRPLFTPGQLGRAGRGA